jgi:hypothetical protein
MMGFLAGFMWNIKLFYTLSRIHRVVFGSIVSALNWYVALDMRNSRDKALGPAVNVHT